MENSWSYRGCWGCRMTDDELVGRLRKSGAASLKVTLLDGTERSVAVPKARTRWSRTMQVLGAMTWTQIECLDRDGRVLCIVENDDAQDTSALDVGDVSIASVAKIMLELQRSTMKEMRSLMEGQLRGMGEVMTGIAEGMRVSSQAYREALTVQRQFLLSPSSQQEEGEGSEAAMMKLLQMWMMIRGSAPGSGSTSNTGG